MSETKENRKGDPSLGFSDHEFFSATYGSETTRGVSFASTVPFTGPVVASSQLLHEHGRGPGRSRPSDVLRRSWVAGIQESEDSLGCGLAVRLIPDPFITPARGASHDGYSGLHQSKRSPEIQ